MTINTIAEFYSFINTDDFAKILADVVTSAGDYSYQGFKPESLFADLLRIKKTKSVSDSDFAKHMGQLLTLLHARGPNVSNMKGSNTKGGDLTITAIQTVIKIYDIKAKATGSPSVITLPRLSQTFPSLSMMIWMALKDTPNLNKPVTENELMLPGSLVCSPNYVPSLLLEISKESSQLVFFIYCMYQGALSNKTQLPSKPVKGGSSVMVKKSKEELFSDASRYAQLSYEGSFATMEQKSDCLATWDTVGKEINMNMLLDSMKIYFLNLTDLNIPEPFTKFHYILAYFKTKNMSVSTMTVEHLKCSFEQMKIKYPLVA